MVFYLILMTVVINLLPDRKYEKYLRLFAGMVLVLLVFEPFADLTGVEAQVAEAFERLTFQNDAKLLKREIEDADGKRMERLVAAYEDAVENDIATMAEGVEIQCLEVDVELDTDSEGGSFGQVVAVEVRVGVAGGGSGEAGAVEAVAAEQKRNARIAANREIADLRTKIGEYYGVEERNIVINLEDK